MFYYLHLTRPPPEQAFSSLPMSITPNIANDLRTEFPKSTDEGIDIHYAWVKSTSDSKPGNASSQGLHPNPSMLGPMTPPQKLMTWTGNSYKEVPVFPPKHTREGERWQLLLCTRLILPGKFFTSIDLAPAREDAKCSDAGRFGAHVFPILSAPVHFSSQKGGAGKMLAERKQAQNERVLKLPSLWGVAVGPLRITEHLSYDLDKKVWDSGIGLSHWLVPTMAGGASAPPIVRGLLEHKAPTILELGAGTGLVSLVLSVLLSHYPETSCAKVITTDLASAMEVLDNNIKINEHWFPNVRPQAVVLDWDDETLPVEVQDGVDFIIMADVTYNTDSFPALVGTLARLSRPRTQRPPPAVLLAYKERDPDERRLWDMARTIGLRLDEVARVGGAGGHPVEIYSGTFELDTSP